MKKICFILMMFMAISSITACSDAFWDMSDDEYVEDSYVKDRDDSNQDDDVKDRDDSEQDDDFYEKENDKVDGEEAEFSGRLPDFHMDAPYAIDLGDLKTETIYEEAFTGKDFEKYDLTMINIWATWCGPCVSELPDLGKIYSTFEPQGVNVVGFLLDTDYEAAKRLLEDSSADYPCIISDGDLLKNLEGSIQYVPTTIFVDSDGEIVGGYVISAKSFDDWSAFINAILAARE